MGCSPCDPQQDQSVRSFPDSVAETVQILQHHSLVQSECDRVFGPSVASRSAEELANHRRFGPDRRTTPLEVVGFREMIALNISLMHFSALGRDREHFSRADCL